MVAERGAASNVRSRCAFSGSQGAGRRQRTGSTAGTGAWGVAHCCGMDVLMVEKGLGRRDPRSRLLQEPANQMRAYLSSGGGYLDRGISPPVPQCVHFNREQLQSFCPYFSPAFFVKRSRGFKMSYRTLSRPIGFALNSARTPAFVRPFSTVLDTPVDPSSQRATPPTRKASVFEDALHAAAPRTNWTKEEIAQVYNTPLIELTHASVCSSSPLPMAQF